MAELAVSDFLQPDNVSTIVGQLYSQDDLRRDSGFTIFYMGINIGAITVKVVALRGGSRTAVVEAHRGRPREILDDLPAQMQAVQVACAQASDLISERFFQPASTVWTQEAV